MAYATDIERAELKASSLAFDACPMVVRFKKGERESELIADDIDHALALQGQWIASGASYVEIFRVLHDGTLNPTIGAYTKPLMVGDEWQTARDHSEATC